MKVRKSLLLELFHGFNSNSTAYLDNSPGITDIYDLAVAYKGCPCFLKAGQKLITCCSPLFGFRPIASSKSQTSSKRCAVYTRERIACFIYEIDFHR